MQPPCDLGWVVGTLILEPVKKVGIHPLNRSTEAPVLRNNPEGVPNLPCHFLVCRGTDCGILSKATATSSAKSPFQLGSLNYRVEPCALESLGPVQQQRGPEVHWEALASPGLIWGISSGWGWGPLGQALGQIWGSQCPGKGQGLVGPPLLEQLGHMCTLLIGTWWGKGLGLGLMLGLRPGWD